MSGFLSKRDVRRLTGTADRGHQMAWLRGQMIPFRWTQWNGPIVPWLALELQPGPPRKPSRQRYSAAIRRQTPGWADCGVIAAIYELAKERTLHTGIEHHVDHDIPLRGRLVSGLHVETNLRIITRDANLAKRNRFDPC